MICFSKQELNTEFITLTRQPNELDLIFYGFKDNLQKIAKSYEIIIDEIGAKMDVGI